MKKPIFVYIISLGCSKNFVDTEVAAGFLIKSGIGITNSLQEASVILINTCGFIPPAREEAETNILEAIKWKKKKPLKRKIIVSGCLTQWDKKLLYPEKYPEVNLWLGVNNYETISEKIFELFSPNHENIVCCSNTNFLYNDKTPRLQLTPAHYAFLKIAEGCNNKCTYCSIPGIRGSLRSRSINSIIKEAENLLSSGVKELILIAQDITSFSTDIHNSANNLSKLIKNIDRINGDHWIRLHYLHPSGITDELIDTIANSKHIIPYLDIPLQHASNKILKAMNRKITLEKINKMLLNLKSSIKNLTLRTTFLVGFPGETDSDFKILTDFINKWKFERLGAFTFFSEPNTKAHYMRNKIPAETATKRAEIIYKIHAKHSSEFNKNRIGEQHSVLIDEINKNFALGRTYMDSPDIDNIVKIKLTGKIRQGEFYKVKITGSEEYTLLAELI
jgi:ribosomal protein S12 methylthiotransferase